MRADFHVFGAIGFQQFWLKKQGYDEHKLLQEIVDKCYEQNLGICAITSEYFDIPEGSRHDRLGFLEKQLPLSKPYNAGKLGNNILIVERQNRFLFLINSQMVIVQDQGKRHDHLVIGSNQVPNNKPLKETILYCNDHGLTQIAAKPFSQEFGIGKELLEKYADEYDAIEWDAQMRLPEYLSFIPKIGKYNQGVNKKAEAFARNRMPLLTTSNAHQIEDIGVAFIEFDKSFFEYSSEEDALESIKDIVSKGRFVPHKNYTSFRNWMRWTSKFAHGIATVAEEDRSQG